MGWRGDQADVSARVLPRLVVCARFVDRVGKGIRGAPRDALIADITPEHARGVAYGVRQTLDTVGAVAGPALAIVAMLWFADNFRAVFWFAVLPAVASVALLIFGVREPERPVDLQKQPSPVTMADVKRLSVPFWWVVGVAALMTLARFSEAFLVLRAQSVGMAFAWVPLVMVVMSLVYALVSYPAGVWMDRGRYRVVLGAGMFALVAADLILARATSAGECLAASPCGGPHGSHARRARGAGRRDRACGPSWYGLRTVQPGERRRHARRQCAGRLAMGCVRPGATFQAGAIFTVLAWLALLVQNRVSPRHA